MSESIKLQNQVDFIITKIKEIANQTRSKSCCISTTSAGIGVSVPAGLNSVAIVQTGAGDVDILLSDGSTYTMTVVGETFVDSGGLLPAYTISGTGTWKWHGIK